MSKEINRYYTLLRTLEKDIDYDLVKGAIEQYLNITKKSGYNPDDVIMKIKNASMDLHETIMDICVTLQSANEVETTHYNVDDWISVNDAAHICAVTPATVRLWIKQTKEPLQSKKLSDRKTVVLVSDIKRFATKKSKRN